MTQESTSLVLAILLGAFIALIAISVRDYLEDRYSSQLRSGNNRIRRELDRHKDE